MVFLQMLNVPWSWKPLPVKGLQVVAALSGVVNDFVWSFPCGAELSLSRVSGRLGYFAQDEVPYVVSPEFHPPVVVVCHFFLIFHHSAEVFVSYFVKAV